MESLKNLSQKVVESAIFLNTPWKSVYAIPAYTIFDVRLPNIDLELPEEIDILPTGLACQMLAEHIIRELNISSACEVLLDTILIKIYSAGKKAKKIEIWVKPSQRQSLYCISPRSSSSYSSWYSFYEYANARFRDEQESLSVDIFKVRYNNKTIFPNIPSLEALDLNSELGGKDSRGVKTRNNLVKEKRNRQNDYIIKQFRSRKSV